MRHASTLRKFAAHHRQKADPSRPELAESRPKVDGRLACGYPALSEQHIRAAITAKVRNGEYTG
jgi:hypothetical protein